MGVHNFTNEGGIVDSPLGLEGKTLLTLNMQLKVSNQQVSLHSSMLIFCQDEFKERLECEICLSELIEGEKARLLPKYNHGYHVDCIHIWFQSHSTCPLYRYPTVVGDEFENPSHLVLGDEANVEVHLQTPNEGPCYTSHLI
ncbi:hypothetical protein GOBAR_DD33554 [Gossypium barbadense]|nr:hypothetical protein GOBAR_DD33554 [Gossypium barbadense]